MRVPDEVRKCVVFLCINILQRESADKTFLPGGTAFFVVLKPDANVTIGYLFTAKHVIEDMQNDLRNTDGQIYIRIELISGEVVYVPTETSQWIKHDGSVDVAVLPWIRSRKEFDFTVIPAKTIVTRDMMKEENIGIGDDVFIAGLFVKRFGKERNIPIIRIGNIAAMADEQIPLRYGNKDAYLIECRSIGGLSGSPVFIHKPKLRFEPHESQVGKNEVVGTLAIDTGWFSLLGLIHGHWDVDVNFDERKSDAFMSKTIKGEAVNMGIAIVTPMEKALEILDQPNVKKKREEEMKRIYNKNLPSTDNGLNSIDI